PGYSCPTAGASCVTTCGDGILAGAESCDDGNTDDGDGCSSACVQAPGYNCSPGVVCTTSCGDGVVSGAEECDDGNAIDNDGCSPMCVQAPGWTCSVGGQPCTAASCGDGIVAGDE